MSSFKSKLSILFQFKKERFLEYVNLYSAYYKDSAFSSPRHNTRTHLPSYWSHARLLKQLVLIPRSVTILTLSRRWLTTSLTTQTRLRWEVRQPLSAMGESHQHSCSSTQSSGSPYNTLTHCLPSHNGRAAKLLLEWATSLITKTNILFTA